LYKKFKSAIPLGKDRYHIWLRFVLRPLSILISIPIIKTGISANTISYLSALVCLMSAAFIVAGEEFIMFGAIGFNLFALMDCVDGNVARYKKQTGPFGEWADALGGYFASVLVLPSVGIAVGLGMESEVLQRLFIGIGVIAGVLNILSRMIQKKYSEVHPADGSDKATGKRSYIRIIESNMGITGFLMPAVLVGVLTETLIFVLTIFSVYYILGSSLFILSLIYRVEKEKIRLKQ